MKRIFFILILAIFISCNSNKKEFDEFSEGDAYLLLNEYVAKDIAKAQEQIILYESQFLEPDFTEADLDEMIQSIKYPKERTEDKEIPDLEEFIIEPLTLEPIRVSKKKWNQNRLKNYLVLGKEFFENDTLSKREYFFKKFNTYNVHTISYPIYFPKYKLAVVYDEPFYVGGLNCIQRTNYYFYLKKENGWESLKSYGKPYPFFLLYGYLKENELKTY